VRLVVGPSNRTTPEPTKHIIPLRHVEVAELRIAHA
jgi:hypothetical protein